MQLCSIINQTYISFDYGIKHVIALVNQNEFAGLIGQCVERMLIKRGLRKCKIIARGYLGVKLPNGSYTGKHR